MMQLAAGLNHASCVSVDGKGVMIRGASGTGKSALALALIALGADLVGDDQIDLSCEDGAVIARPAQALEGKIEARYLGIFAVDHIPSARVHMVVDLDATPDGRLPSAGFVTVFDKKLTLIAGCDVPNLANALYVMLLHLKP